MSSAVCDRTVTVRGEIMPTRKPLSARNPRSEGGSWSALGGIRTPGRLSAGGELSEWSVVEGVDGGHVWA